MAVAFPFDQITSKPGVAINKLQNSIKKLQKLLANQTHYQKKLIAMILRYKN